jgi:pimeloyl-ACP methyl ester carboxylesterase
LKQAYRVVAFDNRGAGRSSQPEGAYTIPQMADDAVALLDHLGIASAHVVGASMGGMIAQEVALRHPERVRTLVLMCTTPGGPNSFGWDAITANAPMINEATDLAALMAPEEMQRVLEATFSPGYLASPGAGFQEYVMSATVYPSTLAGLKGQMAAVLAHDSYDRLPQIRVPTLVLTGDEDGLVDPRNSKLMADRIPGAELRIFPGLRHGFTAERPAEVNAAVLDFVGRKTPTPA